MQGWKSQNLLLSDSRLEAGILTLQNRIHIRLLYNNTRSLCNFYKLLRVYLGLLCSEGEKYLKNSQIFHYDHTVKFFTAGNIWNFLECGDTFLRFFNNFDYLRRYSYVPRLTFIWKYVSKFTALNSISMWVVIFFGL